MSEAGDSMSSRRRWGVAARVIVAVAALAVAGWLAGNLRSLRLADQAATSLNIAVKEKDQGRIEAARGDFVRARRFNDDADLLLREGATLLLVGGGRERAIALERAAAELEPENFVAWATLATAARVSDPALAETAGKRAIALDPSVQSRLRPPKP